MDPIWLSRAFTGDFYKIVSSLTSLMASGELLDGLFSANLLTLSQLEQHNDIRKRESNNEAARKTLMVLMKGLPGSFKLFYETIKTFSGTKGLQEILEHHFESSGYGTDDPRGDFSGGVEIPQAQGQMFSEDDSVKRILKKRQLNKALEVSVVLFLQNHGDEWTLISVCCHEEDAMKRKEEELEKKSCISSNPWRFPLIDDTERGKVIIQLDDSDKEQLLAVKGIVFIHSQLIGSGGPTDTARRLRKAKSHFPASLHFTGSYEHDGKDVLSHAFTFSQLNKDTEEQRQRKETGNSKSTDSKPKFKWSAALQRLWKRLKRVFECLKSKFCTNSNSFGGSTVRD